MKKIKITFTALIALVCLASCSTDDSVQNEETIIEETAEETAEESTEETTENDGDGRSEALTNDSTLLWESTVTTFNDDDEVAFDDYRCDGDQGISAYEFNVDGTYTWELSFGSSEDDCSVVLSESGTYEITGEDTNNLEIVFLDEDDEGNTNASLRFSIDDLILLETVFYEGEEATTTYMNL